MQGLGAVEHQEHGSARVQAPRLQVLQQRHTDRGVLGGALAQAEDALGAIGGDPHRHDRGTSPPPSVRRTRGRVMGIF
jgi:hypothetical protein